MGGSPGPEPDSRLSADSSGLDAQSGCGGGSQKLVTEAGAETMALHHLGPKRWRWHQPGALLELQRCRRC